MRTLWSAAELVFEKSVIVLITKLHIVKWAGRCKDAGEEDRVRQGSGAEARILALLTFIFNMACSLVTRLSTWLHVFR